jgi:hypothetical protein
VFSLAVFALLLLLAPHVAQRVAFGIARGQEMARAEVAKKELAALPDDAKETLDGSPEADHDRKRQQRPQAELQRRARRLSVFRPIVIHACGSRKMGRRRLPAESLQNREVFADNLLRPPPAVTVSIA